MKRITVGALALAALLSGCGADGGATSTTSAASPTGTTTTGASTSSGSTGAPAPTATASTSSAPTSGAPTTGTTSGVPTTSAPAPAADLKEVLARAQAAAAAVKTYHGVGTLSSSGRTVTDTYDVDVPGRSRLWVERSGSLAVEKRLVHGVLYVRESGIAAGHYRKLPDAAAQEAIAHLPLTGNPSFLTSIRSGSPAGTEQLDGQTLHAYDVVVDGAAIGLSGEVPMRIALDDASVPRHWSVTRSGLHVDTVITKIDAPVSVQVPPAAPTKG